MGSGASTSPSPSPEPQPATAQNGKPVGKRKHIVVPMVLELMFGDRG